jgi:hypothetical protein
LSNKINETYWGSADKGSEVTSAIPLPISFTRLCFNKTGGLVGRPFPFLSNSKIWEGIAAFLPGKECTARRLRGF